MRKVVLPSTLIGISPCTVAHHETENRTPRMMSSDSPEPPALSWWQRMRQSLMPVIVGLAIALLLLAFVIGQTVLAQREARTRAIYEGNMLLALQQVRAAMLDAETGQRGFLLTDKATYLTPYRDAKNRLTGAMGYLVRLKQETDDPDIDGHIARLDALTQSKFIELDRSVALASAGFSAQARAIVDSDLGQHEMDAIRAEIAAMHAERAEARKASFERAAQLERRLLPLIAVLGIAIIMLIVAGMRAEHSRARAMAQAAQANALRDANERAQLLARELNHRVKNLFSVILSIVALSGRKQADAHEVVTDIRARIRALSLAHAASQGVGAGAGADLGSVIARTMEPYADEEGIRVCIEGPAVKLPVRMVTPLGLIVHELATNAMKYGALSRETGKVRIDWRITPDAFGELEVSLCWSETGGPALHVKPGGPEGTGFGSQMTELAARQLGGTILREWPETGAVARLTFPLPTDFHETDR